MKSPWKKLGKRVSVAVATLGLAALLGTIARADRPYAPSRDYHLQNVRVSLHFDLDQRKVIGEVTHTLSTLHDGVTHLDFDCAELTVSSARVNGKDAAFNLSDDKLRVQLAQPAKSGEKFEVELKYEGKPTSGLYFILPDRDDPGRAREIWTQGEAEDTHHYIPIYDYPNDRATSEMILPFHRLAYSFQWETDKRAGRPEWPENVDLAAIAARFHLPDFVCCRRVYGKERHLAQHPGYVQRAARG